MTKDANKSITAIQYNARNLPSTVHFTNGRRIVYDYDAAGRKFRVTHKASPMVTDFQTDYCGNVIYEDGILKYLLIEGGYITFNGTTPQYHYYLKDHLGNNRVVMSKEGVVEQVNHYYPCGGLFAESTNTELQPYLYTGKELDHRYGLDWHDYGARHYDAARMQWATIDPLCEKDYGVSPYVYCRDNAINAVDPNGEDVAVLIENAGAGGMGHMAILIQGEDGNWYLYSKNGTANHAPFGRSSHDDVNRGPFDTPDDFLNGDNSNLVQNEKTKEYYRQYDEAYVIETDKNEEAKEGAMSEISKPFYNLLGSNCAETVQKALEGAGLDAGRLPKYLPKTLKIVMSPKVGSVVGMILEETPKLIYYRIKNNNQGEVVKVNNKDEK